MAPVLTIVPFTPDDEPALFGAYAATVEDGGAFPRDPPVDLQTFRSAWIDGSVTVQVGHLHGELVGGYFIRPNFPGTAAHIANAGYVVAPEHRRRGFGARSPSTR